MTCHVAIDNEYTVKRKKNAWVKWLKTRGVFPLTVSTNIFDEGPKETERERERERKREREREGEREGGGVGEGEESLTLSFLLLHKDSNFYFPCLLR